MTPRPARPRPTRRDTESALGATILKQNKIIISFEVEELLRQWVIAFVGISFQLKVGTQLAMGKQSGTSAFAALNDGIAATESKIAAASTVGDKRASDSLKGWKATGISMMTDDGKTMVKSDGELELGPELAKGNFGTVYRGSWKEREVAIKVLNVPDDDEAAAEVAEEFQQEVEMCCRIHHPCVVEFLGYLTEPRLIIVAELMPRGCASAFSGSLHGTRSLGQRSLR